jgi:tetratricopeptide (TPR) repeat protein
MTRDFEGRVALVTGAAAVTGRGGQTARGLRGALLGLALLAVAACAPGGSVGRARAQAGSGDLEAARVELERERGRRPDSADVRVELGTVYYRIARDALDRERDETRYLAFLERSVAEFVTALELDPRDDRPHFYLAVMDTYRGELRKALRGLENVRRLAPSGVAYTNIAELYVYLGELHKARRWNDLGLRKGAPYGVGIFNDMLIAWREGELDEARRRFAELRASDPEQLRTINMVRLPETPHRFEDFAGYCCASPACGPYLKDACRALELDVREREISKQAVLDELRIEMEKERRLRRVYEQRKELEIEVEEAP